MGSQKEVLKTVAELMELSARTAPKSAGRDFIVTKIVHTEEVSKLGDEMVKYGKETGKKNFDRDGMNVKNSDCVLLIGLKDADTLGLNCGGCGSERCEELEPKEMKEFKGPQCALRLLDLGIAIGSAVKTASILNVDNRIMYRAGVVARKMGLIDADVVMGIPISATGKSIYFDR